MRTGHVSVRTAALSAPASVSADLDVHAKKTSLFVEVRAGDDHTVRWLMPANLRRSNQMGSLLILGLVVAVP